MLGLDDGPMRFPTVWWYMYAFMKANVAILPITHCDGGAATSITSAHAG